VVDQQKDLLSYDTITPSNLRKCGKSISVANNVEHAEHRNSFFELCRKPGGVLMNSDM
jgi:hypothetical protein